MTEEEKDPRYREYEEDGAESFKYEDVLWLGDPEAEGDHCWMNSPDYVDLEDMA